MPLPPYALYYKEIKTEERFPKHTRDFTQRLYHPRCSPFPGPGSVPAHISPRPEQVPFGSSAMQVWVTHTLSYLLFHLHFEDIFSSYRVQADNFLF